MSHYFLQISEEERKALLASTTKVKGIYSDDLAAVNHSLRDLRPNHTFIVEVPKGVNPSDVRVISGLEMEADFYVMQAGSNGDVQPVEHVRDRLKIFNIMTGIRLSRVALPLALACDVLRRTLQNTCDSPVPDLIALMMALNVFKPVFQETFQEVAALIREGRRQAPKDHIQLETVE